MTQLIDYLKTIANERRNLIFAALAAFSAALLLFIVKFQRNFFSKTYLALTILVFCAAFLLFAALNHFIIAGFMRKSTPTHRRLLIVSSILLSLILLLNFRPLPVYLLEGDGTLTVRPASGTSAGSAPIALLYARNQLGNIPYADLEISGKWNEEEDRLVLLDGAALSWQGALTGRLEIGFEPAAQPLNVLIIVNGEEREFDLQREPGGDIAVFRSARQPSFLSKLPYLLAFIFLASYLLAALFCLLSSDRLRRKRKSINKVNVFWLGLPFLAASLVTLLVFWPGMMSNDSIDQWEQAVTLQMNDWHPIFHTFLISQLIRIWYSPAVVAILQVLALWAVLMGGLRILQQNGVPRAQLWLIAVIFALFPPNLILPITLWKDIGYSIASLGLFLVVLKAALTSGKWLSEKSGWLVLGLSGFSVALFRQNGLIVAVFSVLLLGFVFRSYRKEVFFSLLIVMAAWFGVRGILDLKFNLEDERPSQANIILLPHLAAHIDAGTPLSAEERTYLDGLMPLAEWDYDCCYIGNISYDDSFDRQTYLRNLPLNLKIAVNLFLRDPLVDIRHQLCASEVVWNFRQNQCTFKSMHAFNDFEPGEESWIDENIFGIRESSLFPAALPFFMRLFRDTGLLDGYPVSLLKPAFFLFLTLVMVTAASFRNRKLLLLLVPVGAQALTLALIIFSPCFRYQYAICLIGIISLGLPFIRDTKEQD